MSAKSTLGYPSRTDAVLALRRQGLSTAAIAAKIGIRNSAVTALEHSAGRAIRAPRPVEDLCRTVLFPIDVIDALGPHAARRGVHPNALARRIVEQVVDDGIVDAVLDDEEVTP
jgi:transcriptional regulator